MFEFCKLFGTKAVLFMSNDDKVRMPLGLTTVNFQAPILMHRAYKVKLMDCDFVIRPQHKLIPSVYGICEITNTGRASYSGETLIRIRSGKHDTSNAYTHAFYVQDLFESKLAR